MAKKKRRKLKKKFRVLILLLIIIGIGGFVFFKYSDFSSFLSKKDDKKVVKKEKKVEEKKPKEYEAKLVMVGDALIHYGIYKDVQQADGSYNFVPMLEYIKPIVSKYDLAYYNQETILGGDDLGISSYPMFNTPQSEGDAFLDAGFNMVSLATNHTMDKGERGVLNSVAYWRSKKDIAYSGQWDSFEDRNQSIAKVYEKNGIKYGFISYTTWTNGLETPYGKEYLNNVYSDEKAAADIALLKDKVDFIIVAMHWGTEYSFGVNAKQDEIGKYLSNLGVDLIIGAHPHVVESCEYINEGKTFVIYSLGNFISDQGDIDNQTGLMMEVTLKKVVNVDDTVTKSVESPKAELIYTKDKRDFRVIPYPKLNDSILPGFQNYYEKYKAVVNEFYPDLTWGLTYQ